MTSLTGLPGEPRSPQIINTPEVHPGSNMRASRLCFVFILVCCLLSCGCTNSPSSPLNPDGEPTVLITSPEFDGGVTAGDVPVTVRVTNFSLVPAGAGIVPGSGHLVYYRDIVPPVLPGRPAFSEPGTYAAVDSLVYVWHNVTPGTHTFSVQLVNVDNTPLDPPAIDAVDVTAVSPAEIAGP